MKLEDYVKKFGGKVDEKTLKIIEERMKRRREKERMRKPQARSSSAQGNRKSFSVNFLKGKEGDKKSRRGPSPFKNTKNMDSVKSLLMNDDDQELGAITMEMDEQTALTDRPPVSVTPDRLPTGFRRLPSKEAWNRASQYGIGLSNGNQSFKNQTNDDLTPQRISNTAVIRNQEDLMKVRSNLYSRQRPATSTGLPQTFKI